MRNALDGLLGQEKSALDRYAPIFEALEGNLRRAYPGNRTGWPPTSTSSSAPRRQTAGPVQRTAPLRIWRKMKQGIPTLHLSEKYALHAGDVSASG